MAILSRLVTPSVSTQRARLATAACCCMLVLLLLATGCGKTILTDRRPVDKPAPAVELSPLDQAKNAFASGDYTLAETISLKLVEGGKLKGADSAEAGRVLAAAALQNKHPSVALTGLEHWRKAAKGVDEGREWQDAWCKALRYLSSHDARTRANQVYQDSSRSALVRSVAGVSMAVRQWQDGELGQTMAALENIYTSASGNKEKAIIEGRLALELDKAQTKAAKLAASVVTAENQSRFPYAVIRIDQLRREAQNPEAREAARAALSELRQKATLADSSLFDGPPKETSLSVSAATAGAASVAVTGRPVVLALPMSGQYSSISAKIVEGAKIACAELSTSGKKVTLKIIDTGKPDWAAQIDALPADVTIVGGPLRRADYSIAKSKGLTSRRVFLTFLPGLEGGDEGQVAWRFFSSAKDQVDALLQFTSRLGVSSYAVFYPQENFGQRMAELFESRAKSAGANNVIAASYEPGKKSGWTVAVNDLLAANKGNPPFKAIFLPDSWKNMDVIVPNFFYYKETRQVLLGTSLWEQGLSGGSFVSGQYYNFAVFPGAWNNEHPSSAAQKLQSKLASSATFWSGLGYDFARMVARMNINTGWTPDVVNSQLASASSMDWSVAPISWSRGIAAQKLFLFTPKGKGFELVDEAAFRSAFEEAWK